MLRPSFFRPPLRRSAALSMSLIAVVAGGALVGCGGSDDETKQILAVQEAREEGRKQAIEEARQKDLEKTAKDLKNEVKRLRDERSSSKSDGSKKSNGSSSGGSTTRSASSGGTSSTSCGNGITVNSVTSCEFARIVRDTFYSSGMSSSISAYSPVTGQAYAMTCSTSNGGATTCRGGNNAQATFP